MQDDCSYLKVFACFGSARGESGATPATNDGRKINNLQQMC